jgi:uncharacterized protein (UPF0548 family)
VQQARLLDAIELTDLQSRPLTYAEVGATATSMPSDGYHRFTRRRTLGPTTLDQAADALMSWQLHLRAGVRVAASSLTVQPDTVVNLHVGFGPWSAAAPCRVVYIVNEQDRRGFAYGTLRGHPESGEELFVLHSDSTGTVQITISAFSRHASLLSRAAGPAARIVQHSVTTRYLRALG